MTTDITLVALRDTLLPKPIHGELRHEHAEWVTIEVSI